MNMVHMPSLGDGVIEGTISRWFVKTGDRIATGDEIAEIETDKVTMACVSDHDGIIEEILVGEGETAEVGAPIARVGAGVLVASEERDEPPQTRASQSPRPTPDASPDVSPDVTAESAEASRRPRATPLARRLAAEQGIDLSTVFGSGPGGVISRHDLRIEPHGRVAVRHRRAVTPPPTSEAPDASTAIELSRAQRVTAERMTQVKATVPEFQVEANVRMDALLALRTETRRVTEQAPSINDFIVKAVAVALRQHPRANGYYSDGRFVAFERVHIGIAVAAEETLAVPVIRDADTLTLGQIAAETRRLAGAVRDGTVAIDDLRGGTFTISNLGMYGVTALTPIINLDQAAILGVGAAREFVYLDNGLPVTGHEATFSLTCDHRILNGADAARFLACTRDFVENPIALLVD